MVRKPAGTARREQALRAPQKRGRRMLPALVALVALVAGLALASTVLAGDVDPGGAMVASTPTPEPTPAPEPAPTPEPAPPHPQPSPQPEPAPEPEPQPAPPAPRFQPAPEQSPRAVPDTEPLPEPLFFGPKGPLDDGGTGAPGPRIALFTDCPNGPRCREARRKGVEAALALEQAGKNYEAQRIVAEATFLAWLLDDGERAGAVRPAFASVQETLDLISELAARGGEHAKIAARLQSELLRAEFRSRGIRVGH